MNPGSHFVGSYGYLIQFGYSPSVPSGHSILQLGYVPV